MARRLSLLAASPSGGGRRLRRTAAIATLTLAVAIVHGCIAQGIADRIGDAADAAAMPQRISLAYVREMVLADAPVASAAPPPAAAPVRVARPNAPAQAASAPAESEPVNDDPATYPVALPAKADAALQEDADSVASSPQAAEPVPDDAPPAFQWPESTRMSYRLTGNYRGPVEGAAQVEWIRATPRYQLHLDVYIGSSMAPLMGRRMSSEGRLTERGLAPERYDEEIDRLFKERRRTGLRFEPDVVVLADGQRKTGWTDVQDAVSQFVQLTFLMTTQPALARPGASVSMPLALPRRVVQWVYDVLEPEVLQTPFGALQSFHLKPRLAERRGGELSAEVWIAPQLQYLPVRIRIEQDAETYIDLMIDRLPQLPDAAAARPGAPTFPKQETPNER